MFNATVSVQRDIDADADQLWSMVSDVTRMPEWSPETVAGEWLHGATAATTGAKFRGRNRNGKKSWSSVATVIDAQPGRAFAFFVKAGGLNVAEWRYTFEPTETGCRVTETWTDRRGALLRVVSPRVTGV
ncbi:MAG: SRPBCC family protein, partial [Actinobacteria bacterium]|nr:SRPBCC family protein [Actinomycetota bacterium]